jgi:hypothetical protein
MKYLGGLLVVAYAALHAFGLDRFPDDDRGNVPPSVRRGPGGVQSWHGGFMGGK